MRSLTLIVICLFGLFVAGHAQKLPDKQKVSIWAPADIKIDGKMTDWDNQFQAFNHSTELYYSIANDDENLYLILKATSRRVIEKIIDVGVTFTVNATGKKDYNAKGDLSLRFPSLGIKEGSAIFFNAEMLSDDYNKGKTTKQSDSCVDIANQLLLQLGKTIKVKGLYGSSDTLISVYNEERIKTSAHFDYRGAYIYKLAVPLKYIVAAGNILTSITYSIKLSDRLLEPKLGMSFSLKRVNGVYIDPDQDLDSTTDFWSEYTLAKKP